MFSRTLWSPAHCHLGRTSAVLRADLRAAAMREAGVDLSSERLTNSIETDERVHSNSTASCSSSADLSGWRASTVVSKQLEAGLYVVGTPIGNLEDITLRALRVLRDSDVVLAEDTRHSRKLLNHFQIGTRLQSFHEHNERSKQNEVLGLLQSGLRVALISDAGMPLVSDPGANLVRAVTERNIAVFPVPGPSAILAALVASGLQTDKFLFCGFLPPKQGARLAAIERLKDTTATMIFFAPPHALPQILRDLASGFGGDRRCVVARELTKVHEEFFRATLAEASLEFDTRQAKGEVTLAVEGAASTTKTVLPEAEVRRKLEELLEDGCSVSTACKVLARTLQQPRNSIYAIATDLKRSASE